MFNKWLLVNVTLIELYFITASMNMICEFVEMFFMGSLGKD